MDVFDEQDFAKFEYNVSFGRISYFTTVAYIRFFGKYSIVEKEHGNHCVTTTKIAMHVYRQKEIPKFETVTALP